MLTLHYEARLGLARGAVYKDGLPHFYLEGYEHDPSLAVLGARSVARLTATAGGVRFLALADGGEAVLDAPSDAKLTEGMAVEVEIMAEARPVSGKLARARFIAPADSEPRRLSEIMSLRERLLTRATAVFGNVAIGEDSDRAAILEASERAENPSGRLANGGHLWVEATRGLIACDVDAAEAPGHNPARACNELAVKDLPRRLRLANLGGLVVVDLIGRRHDGERLRRLLIEALAGEARQAIVAPIGRFGTLEFTRPWSAAPPHPLFNPLRSAIYMLWQAIALSEQDRGRPVVIRTFPAAADILKPLINSSLDPLAPMLRLEAGTTHKADYA